jgi:hypothetical protein
MDKSFLGRGWRFPIIPDESGKLNYSEGEENIEHSLRVLLLTAVGERVMRNSLGTRAPRLVFAPGGERHLKLLETTVREAVRDWEPRVELLRVDAEADVNEPERVEVSVSYSVRATNTRTNIVFPFYLDTLEAL